MSLLSAARKRPDPVSLSFLAVTFMTGVAVALQVPTLSLFLAEEVQVRPFLVGLFYTVNAVIGILISQWLGHRSDNKGDRKQLILLAELARPLEEDLPRRRQHRLASPYLQQGYTQTLLQLGDRMIEGGLALVQRLGGLGVAATVHHGLKDPPLLKRALGTKHIST